MGIIDFLKKKQNERKIEKEEKKREEKEKLYEELKDMIKSYENNTEDEIELDKEKQDKENDFNNITENIKIINEDIAEKLEYYNKEENIDDELEKKDNKEDISSKKKGFFAKIKAGLGKTRKNIMNSVEQVLKSFSKIDDDLFDELEEALIMADIGVETSVQIIERVKEIVKKEKITEVDAIKDTIIKVITDILNENENEFIIESPSVILVIGVNGVGKTTTIGKLTHNFKMQNKKVILAAADTFRAAAIDQLQIWGERSGVDVIKHQENSDPGAVVFDAVQAAKARKADILICDTAGRLHNKKNLMEELKKIFKIISREYENAHLEVLLVLDATTGQNALQQAKTFKEVADITGIVLTKLDGTAKGGIIIAIKNELKIPVRFIGIGEGIDDLQEFNAEDFAKALFDI